MKYTITEIKALHKKYAPSDAAFQMVFTHCQIVCDIAKQLIEKSVLDLDVETVITGALLHDIGVYHYFEDGKLLQGKKSVAHGQDSEEILKTEGFPENIWRIGSHHTGVYLTKQDVVNQKLPMPPNDYTPKTIEEQLVQYADKFHTKGPKPVFNSFEWYRKEVTKYGADKIVKFDELAAKFGKPDLKALSTKYQFEIR